MHQNVGHKVMAKQMYLKVKKGFAKTCYGN